jgi:hypothetical protein
MPCNQAVSNQIITIYQIQQPNILTVYHSESRLLASYVSRHKAMAYDSTTAVVAVMRASLKDGYTHQRSIKNCKQNIVGVLLDSCSNGDFIFVNKDKPILLPYLKRLVPQSWNTSNGIFQMQRKARIELNFFEYSDSKRYHVEPDVVKYNKINRPQYDLVLSTASMNEFGIILNF